jgi:hypothetical protein
MIVTIETCVGVSTTVQVTDYSFSITCDQDVIIQNSRIKLGLNKEEAEVMCIKSALSTLLDSGITGIAKVIIKTT